MAKQSRPTISAKIIAERDSLREQAERWRESYHTTLELLSAEKAKAKAAENQLKEVINRENELRDVIHRLELEVERQKGYLERIEDEKPPELMPVPRTKAESVPSIYTNSDYGRSSYDSYGNLKEPQAWYHTRKSL